MEELYHYGVKGMKWGVRKSVYKSANRKRRKQIRTNFYKKNPGYRVARNTAIGAVLGGPFVGAVSGVVTAKNWNYNPYVTAARMMQKYSQAKDLVKSYNEVPMIAINQEIGVANGNERTYK